MLASSPEECVDEAPERPENMQTVESGLESSTPSRCKKLPIILIQFFDDWVPEESLDILIHLQGKIVDLHREFSGFFRGEKLAQMSLDVLKFRLLINTQSHSK